MHVCRGNFRSAWAAEGGYDPVAEILFKTSHLSVFDPVTRSKVRILTSGHTPVTR